MLSSKAIFGPSNSWRRQDSKETLQIQDFRLFSLLSADLRNLLLDIAGLARLLNDANRRHGPKLNIYAFHDTLILCGYRLLHISTLGGPRPTSYLENLVHLALTAFLMTMMRGLDHKISNIPLLSYLARLAAAAHLDNEQENQEVLLWMLFIGGASIFRQPDDLWLIPKITHTMSTLGLCTWQDVVQTLVKFPWVNAVHDKAGEALWQRSTSNYKSPPEVTLQSPIANIICDQEYFSLAPPILLSTLAVSSSRNQVR